VTIGWRFVAVLGDDREMTISGLAIDGLENLWHQT